MFREVEVFLLLVMLSSLRVSQGDFVGNDTISGYYFNNPDSRRRMAEHFPHLLPRLAFNHPHVGSRRQLGDTHGCHNSTGSCLTNGSFMCLNREVVPWSRRCDGFMDCADTTDEYLCELPPIPRAEVPQEDQHRFHEQFSMSTCLACQCLHGDPLFVDDTHPWFKEALMAGPSDLITYSSPQGVGCHPQSTSALFIQLYRKNKLCRMAVCCAKQTNCFKCYFGKLANTKCYI